MFQSPFNYPVLVSPAEYDAVIALADALIEVDRSVPGVGSSAAVAAQFAGRWTELTGQGARPTRGMRLYEAVGKNEVPASRGKIREAGENDRELVVRWMGSFLEDVNEPARDVEQVVGSGVEERRFWLWEDGSTPVSMAARSIAVEGVVRIQAVYTPPEQRNRGYAGACVGALTAQLLASGLRCILYTDLANPTSNSVYRRIGYRAVDEGLRYEFETGEG
jgi:predicted GNAT family acetyltransferase